MKEYGTLRSDKCETYPANSSTWPMATIWVDGYVFESMDGAQHFPYFILYGVLNTLLEQGWKLKTSFGTMLIFEREK